MSNRKITLVDIAIPEVNGNRLSKEPLGILQLGAYLKNKTDSEINYVISEDECNISNILEYSPEIVGFSTYTYNYLSAYRLAQKIKKQNPDIQIVFGGPHAGVIPEQVYSGPNKYVLDAVLTGYGEKGFLDFLKGKRGVIRPNENIPLTEIPKLDRLPYLFRNKNVKFLGEGEHKVAGILSSRACNRSCEFCPTRKTGYEPRPIDNVINEIEYLSNEHKIEFFVFGDPLLNGNIKNLEKLCNKLGDEKNSGSLKNFQASCMCDFVFGKNPKRIFEKMAESGITHINWGIEDPRQKYREELGKKVKLQSEILKLAKQSGIYNRGLLMIPTNLEAENPEKDVREYSKSLQELDLDEIKLPNIRTPFPGTPFFDELLKEEKILSQEWRLYDTNHLVFNAGKWTSEIVNWGRNYIFEEFNKSRGKIF